MKHRHLLASKCAFESAGSGGVSSFQRDIQVNPQHASLLVSDIVSIQTFIGRKNGGGDSKR